MTHAGYVVAKVVVASSGVMPATMAMPVMLRPKVVMVMMVRMMVTVVPVRIIVGRVPGVVIG